MLPEACITYLRQDQRCPHLYFPDPGFLSCCPRRWYYVLYNYLCQGSLLRFPEFSHLHILEWLYSRSLASPDPVGLAPELWYCRPTDAVDGCRPPWSPRRFMLFYHRPTWWVWCLRSQPKWPVWFSNLRWAGAGCNYIIRLLAPATMLSDTLALSRWWSVLTISAILSLDAPLRPTMNILIKDHSKTILGCFKDEFESSVHGHLAWRCWCDYVILVCFGCRWFCFRQWWF